MDLLVSRSDFERVKEALTAAGFLYHETLDVQMFLDGPQSGPREAVHVLFSEEKVQEDYLLPTPAVSETVQGDQYRVLALEALVRMKLTSFRRKDQVHIQDLIGIGLIDATWPARSGAAQARAAPNPTAGRSPCNTNAPPT